MLLIVRGATDTITFAGGGDGWGPTTEIIQTMLIHMTRFEQEIGRVESALQGSIRDLQK